MKRLLLWLLVVALASTAIAQAPNSLVVCVVDRWSAEDDPCQVDYLGCGAFLITGTTSPGKGQIVWCNDDATPINELIGPTRTTSGGVYSFGAAGSPNYERSFSSLTTVVLEHNLGTDKLLIQCHGSDDKIVQPDTVSIGRSGDFDATVTFFEAQSGRCMVNGLMNAGRHVESFTGQTSVSVPGSTHGLGADAINVSCFDDQSPPNRVEPDVVTVALSTFDVVITFEESETGKCVLQ